MKETDDVLKHLGYNQVWRSLKAILLYPGDTADLLSDNEHDNESNDEPLESSDRGVKISNPEVAKPEVSSGSSYPQDSNGTGVVLTKTQEGPKRTTYPKSKESKKSPL